MTILIYNRREEKEHCGFFFPPWALAAAEEESHPAVTYNQKFLIYIVRR